MRCNVIPIRFYKIFKIILSESSQQLSAIGVSFSLLWDELISTALFEESGTVYQAAVHFDPEIPFLGTYPKF